MYMDLQDDMNCTRHHNAYNNNNNVYSRMRIRYRSQCNVRVTIY